MKLFVDTGNLKEIEALSAIGILYMLLPAADEFADTGGPRAPVRRGVVPLPFSGSLRCVPRDR